MGFFAAFLEQLKRFVLPEIIPGFYSQQGSKVEKTKPPEFFISFLGSRDSQSFVNHLALFFVAFLRENLTCWKELIWRIFGLKLTIIWRI
jgi:hypothetical protein